MDFHYLEDKKYFINLLAKGDEERFEKESRCLFDFRSPQIKRDEFNKIRNKVLKELIKKHGLKCQLNLIPECEKDKNIVVDHFIPLSSNILNKILRNLKPENNKKVKTQSYGSNHQKNFILACGKCNGYKKHRFIKIPK